MLNAKWREIALDALKDLQEKLSPKAPDRWSPARPSRSAYDQAKLVLNKMPDEPLPEPLVQATVDGGVQFEWEQDNRELDIEVSSAGELGYLKVISRAAVEEGPLNLDSLRSLAAWLRSGP